MRCPKPGTARQTTSWRSGVVEDPAADLADEVALLGERDEALRQEHAERRVRPADERLEAEHLVVAHPHDRLEHEVELVVLDGAAQVACDLDPLGEVDADRVVKYGDGVATGLLGLVDGRVGVADQHLGIERGVRGREGHPDRRRDEELGTVDVERRPQAPPQPVGQGAGLGDTDGPAEHDDELVAADPADEIAGAGVLGETLGDLHEELVAVAVAERVVDELEPVEVEEHQPDGRTP